MAGKVALVTGSTSGIGASTARLLAARGCSIVLHGLPDTQTAADDVKQQIKSKHNVPVDFIPADLKSNDDVKKLCQGVKELYPGGIDIMVLNAGECLVAPIEYANVPDFEELLRLLVVSPFALIQEFLPQMKAKGSGRVVLTSSYVGVVGQPYLTTYSAAKHAQLGLMKSVALEVAQSGVTCNAVLPTATMTPMLEKNAAVLSQTQGVTKEQAFEIMKEGTPTRKYCDPEQVAEVIEFLCLSGASSQITGASYTIDGGATAQ